MTVKRMSGTTQRELQKEQGVKIVILQEKINKYLYEVLPLKSFAI